MNKLQINPSDSVVAQDVKYLEQQSTLAMEAVDDIVLKKYMLMLESMDIIPLDTKQIIKDTKKNVRMFKINEIVYAKDEDATYKLASVLNSVAITESATFIIMDSDGTKVDFYMGIRSLNEQNSTTTSFDTLRNAMNGHFPGIKTENVLHNGITAIFEKVEQPAISIVTGVANYKDETLRTNVEFIQGLEKLALSMQGNTFTGLILANPLPASQLEVIREQYENIYTMLSPFTTTQVSYGTNDSRGDTQTYTTGKTAGESLTESSSNTTTNGTSSTTNGSTSYSKETLSGTTGKVLGGTLTAVGALLGSVVPGFGTIMGATVGGTVGGIVGTGIASAMHGTKSTTTGSSQTYNSGKSETEGTSSTTNYSENESHSDATSFTKGTTENTQLTLQNKKLQNYLSRIDQQLERLQEGESLGMWECAAYFTSETPYAADMAAATYQSLMQGSGTGVETSTISRWSEKNTDSKEIKNYISNFMHPEFIYRKNGLALPVLPTAIVSGKELAIHMALPRKSVSGFPVIEHAEFAPEIICTTEPNVHYINLGKIHNFGKSTNNRVKLDLQSLSMHTLVTGATGSGKSNTIYELLAQLEMQGISYLVIEPAKGEYKHIFGQQSKVTVLGTNPNLSKQLKINPFIFPAQDTHVLEHIDRLVELFNVCWPMYAAMPAILKEAILVAYQNAGWDLDNSEHEDETIIYPTFKDLLKSLTKVIEQSAYEGETKGNYIGSLITRVKSLTNGINGQILCGDELDNTLLFDTNVIVDLSRIGSSETKALIMGVLVMRLNEHRMAQAKKLNAPLQHVTVLEEAHHILKKTSTEQSAEGANVIGKSVEMLANAIAEMRTYGEGFIIADQSPNMLDMSAIRNTNTKIVMRLPEEADRRLVGKAAGLNEEQLDEIVKLSKGVAVVYQNDWLEPVLCQVNHFKGKETKYIYTSDGSITMMNKKEAMTVLLTYLLRNRVSHSFAYTEKEIIEAMQVLSLSTSLKRAISNYGENQPKYFEIITEHVYELVDAMEYVPIIMKQSADVIWLHERLTEKIENQTMNCSKEVVNATIQCLFSFASRNGIVADKSVYEAWRQAFEEGAIV